MLFKYKYIKKINLLILQIFFCIFQFNCYAGSSKLTEIDLDQQQSYISNSIDAFFKTKPDNSEKTVNHIFSPYSLEGCLIAYGKTQLTHSIAKDNLNKKLIKLGINPSISLSSKKKSKLQLLTAILTRNEVIQDCHDILNSENIFLGEYLLQQDDNTNDNIKNQRQEFQEKIQHALTEMFSGNLNLDYQAFWSSVISSDTYLKVVSAIKFQDDWRYKPFHCMGLNIFYTKDNQQIQADFIKTTVERAPVRDNASNWQAIRLFYEHNYAIDIILPTEKKQITNSNKKKIICSLIKKLNQNKINYKQDTNVIMPKFEHRQKNFLDNYVYKILEGITPDYRGFLVDLVHTNLLSIDQYCYIKIDKNGTTAEDITNLDVDSPISYTPVKDFLVNRSYFFVISEYQKINIKGNPFKTKNIIMIGEVGNPSEQLTTPNL
jgi:serine protease inhibitor